MHVLYLKNMQIIVKYGEEILHFQKQKQKAK